MKFQQTCSLLLHSKKVSKRAVDRAFVPDNNKANSNMVIPGLCVRGAVDLQLRTNPLRLMDYCAKFGKKKLQIRWKDSSCMCNSSSWSGAPVKEHMAVSTTLRQAERSAAHRHAVWRPKLSGLRSAATVHSQD